MAGELQGHIALVTGAGRGIGRAIALRLAVAGCDLALVSRTAEDLERLADEVGPTGARTLILPADITDDTQAEAILEKTLLQLGSISILVNSAGTAPPRRVHGNADIADPVVREAFETFIGTENLEDRVDFEKLTIDLPALEFLRRTFG